jgi:hypothetical protein
MGNRKRPAYRGLLFAPKTRHKKQENQAKKEEN